MDKIILYIKYTKHKPLMGFTMIELLVVLLIIAILSSIAVPGFNKAMENAREREARTTLTAVYAAEKAYYFDYKEYAGNFAVLANYVEDPNDIQLNYDYAIYNVTKPPPSGTPFSFKASATRKPGGPSKVLIIGETGNIT